MVIKLALDVFPVVFNVFVIVAKPTDPVVTSDPSELRDGESVKFRCVSEANPKPELRFSLGSSEYSVMSDVASPERLLKQGVLEWETVISKESNEMELTCEVVNHMYQQDVVNRTKLVVYCKFSGR